MRSPLVWRAFRARPRLALSILAGVLLGLLLPAAVIPHAVTRTLIAWNVAAFGYLATAGLFALDSLQLRGRVTAAAVNRFDVTIGWALVRFGFAEIVCLWLAACALLAARALARQASPRETANRLVVGVPGAGASPIPR